MRNPGSASGGRILVRMPNWLGDAVMAVGFLNRLTEGYPGAAVHAIVREELADFARLLPQVQAVHACHRDRMASALTAPRLARRIAGAEGFDWFYCLPASFSSAFMGLFTRSRDRIGYRGQWRSWTLTRAYGRPAAVHRAAEYAHLLHERLPDAARGLTIAVTPRAADACPGFAGSDRPLIGLNINSDARSRQLSPARGALIADALVGAFDCAVVLIGARAQAARAAALAAGMRRPDRCIDMSGKTTLPQLAWLLARLDAFVSVDSGPAHLANAVGTMTVVLFGAGNEARTAPWNTGQLRVLGIDGLPCRRCGENICRFGTPSCLEDLPVDAIVAAVRCRTPDPRL